MRRAGTSADEVDPTFDRTDRRIDFVDEDALAEIPSSAGFDAPTRLYRSLLWDE